MNKIKLIYLKELKCHEQTQESRVLRLMKMIEKKGEFIKPIVVEKNSKVILDGHHRVEAIKRLGYTKIPARLVNYNSVSVSLRHKNLPAELIKKLVLLVAEQHHLLPRKTTKHFVGVTNPKVAISLYSLN